MTGRRSCAVYYHAGSSAARLDGAYDGRNGAARCRTVPRLHGERSDRHAAECYGVEPDAEQGSDLGGRVEPVHGERPGGDTITKYQFWDSTTDPASGHWW